MDFKENINSDVVVSHKADSISLGAGEMSMSIDRNAGNFILGPLSITSPFTNIRFNSGLYKLNSLLLSTMPSTVVTPVPTFEIDPPVKSTKIYTKIIKLFQSTEPTPTPIPVTNGIRG